MDKYRRAGRVKSYFCLQYSVLSWKAELFYTLFFFSLYLKSRNPERHRCLAGPATAWGAAYAAASESQLRGCPGIHHFIISRGGPAREGLGACDGDRSFLGRDREHAGNAERQTQSNGPPVRSVLCNVIGMPINRSAKNSGGPTQGREQ